MIWFALFTVAFIALAYKQAPLKVSAAVTVALLAALFLFGNCGFLGTALLAAVLLVPQIILMNVGLRQKLLTSRILTIYRKIMPSMSDTEKAALDAGTVTWEADLFTGNPNWDELAARPGPKLSEEEQAFLDGPVEELCGMLDSWQIEQDGDLPANVWKFIRDNGFFGIIVEKKYGGLEFSAYAHSQILAKIGAVNNVAAVTVAVPNSLGPGELLHKYGTQEQKEHYLPRLAQGKETPCFALTAPTAGSDATSIPDFGVVCKGKWKGKEITGMKLTWSKRYITLAPVATVLGLAFKLYDPDGLIGDKKDHGITCALIPTDTKGVKIGRRHMPIGSPFQNGPTQGTEVFVPLDYIIGGVDMAGEGWRMLVECLSVGRAVSLPTSGTTTAKASAVTTGAYARLRKQFNMPISKMEGVEEALARMGGRAYATDAMREFTLASIDNGAAPSVASAIVKMHATDMGQKNAIDGMDIMAGKAVMTGPKNIMAQSYTGAPVSITVEGANILTRSMIIYGQGAIRCHPYVLAELQSAVAENPEERLSGFDKAFWGHIGFVFSNLARTIVHGITDGRLAKAPDGPNKRYYQRLSRYSAVMALLSDVSMFVIGGELKRRERISARLGDLLSHLYIGSAVLKRHLDQGSPSDDLPLAHYALEQSLFTMQTRVDEILRNFPSRPVAWILRALIFPTGRCYGEPSDKLGHKVAKILSTPGSARDRINAGLENNADNAVNQLENAFRLVIAAEPLNAKIDKAIKQGLLTLEPADDRLEKAKETDIINAEEFEQLSTAQDALMNVINVDDFAA